MVFINKVDRTGPPTQPKKTRRAKKKGEENFADTFEAIISTDAVEVTTSKDEDEKQESKHKNKDEGEEKTTKKGGLNITA